ncbi:MAG: succinate dehydrogenase, cytochrome b556 subunit [Wenzhouxiangellaceae bacterium]
MKARPLSPHLQVYRPQLTSVLSIMHRLTGLILLLFALLWLSWLAALVNGAEAYAKLTSLLAGLPGQLILIAVSWALFYHMANGIRHLLWDAGWLLDLSGAYASGWTVLIVSFAATGIYWGMIL